ncbi:MAG: molybdenum cofactor guanylyltransferase [Dehalococcoidales bacterium]|nr:molybdenum cofactor guanylyltransferase [Dehalococcoidales bacterium]
MKITSVILAGGKNLRLGRNKALESINGKSLIERVIERLSPLSNRILIVTSREGVDLPVAGKAEILADIYPGKGPLGGIYTGLTASRSSRCIVVACDMPFLNTRLLGYMVKLSRDFDAVVPRLDGEMLEPLHAIYSKKCLDSIRATLEQDQLRTYSFFNAVRVRYLERAECQKFDPQLLSFFNINFPADLDRAIALAPEVDVGRNSLVQN